MKTVYRASRWRPRAQRWPPTAKSLRAQAVAVSSQADELSFGRRLSRRRQSLGWTLERLAYEMRLVADNYGIKIANTRTLVPKLSRWQHDENRPGQQNLHVLAEALGISARDLGLYVDPDFPWPPPRRHISAETSDLMETTAHQQVP
jgi:transcriptional regulator with XRE-family HTH domain